MANPVRLFAVIAIIVWAACLALVNEAPGQMPSANRMVLSSCSQGGIDQFTTTLLHFDGVNGATTFLDSSKSGRTYSVSGGTVALNTTTKKLGSASGNFTATSSAISTATNADWDFGAGNFTIDYWMQPPASGGGLTLTNNSNGNVFSGFGLGSNTTTPFFQAGNGSSNVAGYTATISITAGTWNHFAFVRNGTTFLIFLNGTSISLTTSTAISTNTIGAASAAMNVGTLSTFAPVPFLDELRVSKGIARWTSNFTPPSRPYC
jgi:hypothetical protein